MVFLSWLAWQRSAVTGGSLGYVGVAPTRVTESADRADGAGPTDAAIGLGKVVLPTSVSDMPYSFWFEWNWAKHGADDVRLSNFCG